MLPGWNIFPSFCYPMSCPSFPFFLLVVVEGSKPEKNSRKEDSIRAEEFGKASLFQLEQGLGSETHSVPLIVSEDIEAVQSTLRHLIKLTNGSDDSTV